MENLLHNFEKYCEPYLFLYLFPLFFVLEALFKLNKKQVFTKNESIQNLGWMSINDYVLPYIGSLLHGLARVSLFPFLWSLPAYLTAYDISKFQLRIENPFYWIPIVLLARDFISWIIHKAMHTNRFLWRFHVLHHSSTELNALAGFRGYWLEALIIDLAMAVPVFFFQVPPYGLIIIGVWEISTTLFIHSNINLRKGGIYILLTSPLYHHWHHAEYCHYKHGQNFGIYTNIFDRLFGSYYCPDTPPERYGITGQSYPKNFLIRLIHPFFFKKNID